MSLIIASAGRNQVDHKHQESSRRVSQASSTLMPKNHSFNAHKADLFSQVMRDNTQSLILSTVKWIF